MSRSDFVGLSTNPGSILWFNQTKLETTILTGVDILDQPLPDAQFPFPRLGRAQELNGTGAYIYHQMNDSIIAEEIWNDSLFWQKSKNISITT